MEMRTRETPSRQNHPPLLAHLDAPGETSFSVFCVLPWLAVDCDKFGSLLTLPRQRSCTRKQAVSNALAVSSFEINASCGSECSASNPQAGKPFRIKAFCGIAEWRPSFVKKSKATSLH